MKKLAYHNLGCRVNGYEMEVMLDKLQNAGFEIVPFDEKADVYVVNTCTVTNIADRKSRQMLHRAKKLNPDALVVAVGCYVETDTEGVLADAAVDVAIGNNRKNEVAEIIQAILEEKAEEKERLYISNLTDHPVFESMNLPQSSRYRAFIKIQDGCNQFCSYCIIPYARGRIRSRSEEEILAEAKSLAENGAREITLTGIHLSSYGVDRGAKPGEELLALLEKLSAIPRLQRIAFGSMEPRVMTDEFIMSLSRMPKIEPHFHLSLQSGCDATLKRMNRHYTAKEYADVVQKLRVAYDRPSITTDVIVGFPGETEEEFEETKRFLEELNLYELHIFKYSVRKGTVAAGLPNQVDDAVKAERSDILQELTLRQSQGYRRSFDGMADEILTEEVMTYAEMKRRTQNEMADVKAGTDLFAEEPMGRAPKDEDKFLVGHTTRYLTCAIPLSGNPMAEAFLRPGMLIYGRFGDILPGTPYLLLMPIQ